MQTRNRVGAGVADIDRAPSTDFSVLKARIIREARIAQAAAIRAAFARMIATALAFTARLTRPPSLPSPETEHGD